MLSHPKHPWRRTFLQALLLYTLCTATLLWLLPPPIHFIFARDKITQLFKCTTEPSLVSLHSKDGKVFAMQDYVIQRINLQTGAMQEIPLDPGEQWTPSMPYYRHSLDGSLFIVVHQSGLNMISLWDGHNGKIRFVRKCNSSNLRAVASTQDGTRLALIPLDDPQAIEIIDARTGQVLGRLKRQVSSLNSFGHRLQFSLDGKSLLYTPVQSGNVRSQYELFNTSTMTQVKQFEPSNTVDEICSTPSGFWIQEWNRSEETITLSHLDGQTGQRTTLSPELSRRLGGFPFIFSDNAGHLYLLQTRKSDPDHWQQRARRTLISWLSKIGFEWETTDEIQIRQISSDGKRIINEQNFSANYAEISPDGQYLILMSQMKNDSRYIVYHYPTRLNWKHSLLWPLLPAILLLLLRRGRMRPCTMHS